MILAKKAMARLWIPDPLYLSSKLLSCYDYGRFTSSGIFPRSRPKRSLSRSLATAQPKCSAGCDSLPCRPRFVTMKFSQGDTVACPALQKAFYLGGILAHPSLLSPTASWRSSLTTRVCLSFITCFAFSQMSPSRVRGAANDPEFLHWLRGCQCLPDFYKRVLAHHPR